MADRLRSLLSQRIPSKEGALLYPDPGEPPRQGLLPGRAHHPAQEARDRIRRAVSAGIRSTRPWNGSVGAPACSQGREPLEERPHNSESPVGTTAGFGAMMPSLLRALGLFCCPVPGLTPTPLYTSLAS